MCPAALHSHFGISQTVSTTLCVANVGPQNSLGLSAIILSTTWYNQKINNQLPKKHAKSTSVKPLNDEIKLSIFK
jgi:hypothetical protein